MNGGSGCGVYAPLTRQVREQLEVRLRRRSTSDTHRRRRGTGPGSVNVIVWLIVPSGAIGGCRWMIVREVSRTMIRWTPVWGPEPRLVTASAAAPFGCWITNDTRTGFPGATGADGVKFGERVRASPPGSVGPPFVDDEPPQPARSSVRDEQDERAPDHPIPFGKR